MTKSFHLRSDYIIRRLLKELGLERVTPSTYAEYSYIDVETQKRSTLRVRISDHGVILLNWYRHYGEADCRLSESDNIAVTFIPNREECQEKGITYPPKIVNKTKVYANKEMKTDIEESFVVMHYLYRSWKLTEEDIIEIVAALKIFINGKGYSDPLAQKPSRADVFKNTSNIPYESVK